MASRGLGIVADNEANREAAQFSAHHCAKCMIALGRSESHVLTNGKRYHPDCHALLNVISLAAWRAAHPRRKRRRFRESRVISLAAWRLARPA